MRLVLASRKSHLARLQAGLVGSLLEERFPDLEVVYSFRESLGDKNAHDPLWQMPERGVFTEDFVSDLVEGKCDLVVHSWKDLPIEERQDTCIAATLPRADRRDLLLMRRDRFASIPNKRSVTILTSSPRRVYNLEPFLIEGLPWDIQKVDFAAVRGNVPTRISKLLSGDADGLIVAKAAMDRLLLAKDPEFAEIRRQLREAVGHCRWMVLPVFENPPAAAQGALALEVAVGNTALIERLAAINDVETFVDVIEERKILASHGGGCHQKIGVSVATKPYGTITRVKGMTDGGEILDHIGLGPVDSLPGRPVNPDCVWPLRAKQSVFDRELLPVKVGQIGEADALWAARATAVPESWSIPPDTVVWTSGLETWRRLARRGIWVNGSAESLGESEDPRIEALCGESPRWIKLSHTGGHDTGRFPVLGTYRLEPRSDFPDLGGKTHFYWASGSLFQKALELYPHIRDAWHASGPGNTHDIIRDTLGPQAKIQVFLNHASWLAYFTEKVCHETADAP